MRNPDDSRLRHANVLHQNVLNLARVDPVVLAEDHLLDAVHVEEAARDRVLVGEIACGSPFPIGILAPWFITRSKPVFLS